MARNKKVEILSNDKEVLHPMTDGDCVIFEDGQTLTQKLSEDDSVKYTPEIVNSSPMFKVGEGNTVDYSDNVLDGAYERATLQGQTYTNYIQESSADEVTLPTPFTEYERTQHNTLTSDEEGTLGINLVGQSYVNALQHDSEEEYVVLGESLEFQEKKVEYTNEGQIKSAMLKGQTLVNLASNQTKTFTVKDFSTRTLIIHELGKTTNIKPNTKYLLSFRVSNIVLDGQTSIGLNFNNSLDDSMFQGTVGMRVPQNGIYKSILTTNTSEMIKKSTLLIKGDANEWENTNSTTRSLTISEVQLIEYQDGMENWDIPYFEGMQSVTVSTRLENLCHKYNDGLAKNGKTFTTNSLADRCIKLVDYKEGAEATYGMKPNTKYLVQFKISNLVLDGLSSLGMVFSVGESGTTNYLFKDAAKTGLITANGIYRVVLTTSDLVSTSGVEIKGMANEWENSGSSLRSMTISEIMYVEYQNGMENWNLPYFEDYQVMKPVQVETTNRNLFDTSKNGKLYHCDMTAHSSSSFTLTGTDMAEYKNVPFKIDVKPNTDYYIQVSSEVVSGNPNPTFDIYSVNNKYLYGSQVTKFNSGDNTWLSFRFYVNISNSNAGSVKYTVQLEESSTATEYVPHQSKTTYSWDEVILRKIGDVEDTLDLTTGEWVQRIGEIVLDGSSDEVWQQIGLDMWATTNGVQDSFGYIYYFQHNYKTADYIGFHEQESDLYTLCDKLPVCSRKDSKLSAKTNVCTTGGASPSTIQNNTMNTYIGIKLDTTKATTLDEFKTWLKQNPLKVQVVMNKPIVRKVNLSRPNLQVYDDITHVHTKCLDGTLIPNIYLPSDVSYPAILEPGKKYNVCVNHTEVSADNPLKVNVGGTEITMTDSRMTLTTPTTLANSNVSFTGKGNKIKESMLIKNSSLLTRDLPHFNGIGSVQLGKTVENLCEARSYGVGTATFTEVSYNDKIVVTVTKKGSLVYAFELTRQLENGKQYYVYVPNTYPTNYQGVVGFRKMYNGTLTFAAGAPGDGVQKSKIIEINQTDNPYTHLTFGRHGGDLPANTVIELQRPIICEYEPGMENWDWESIGYFTGTKNIGNEFMRVQNKNFYPYGDSSFTGQQGNTWYWLNGKGCSFGESCVKKNMGNAFYLKKGSYVLSYNDNNSCQTNFIQIVGEYEKIVNLNNIKQDGWYAIRVKTTTDNIPVNITNIQLEESSTGTTYTAHKHNGLYITKDQPIELTWEQGAIFYESGVSWSQMTNNVNSMRIRTPQPLTLEPNKTYRVSLGSDKYQYGIQLYNGSNNGVFDYGWNTDREFIFTTTKDKYKVGIAVGKIDSSNSTPITPSESVHAQVRLEEVTDVVLRSCSGKYDELDLTRGTYTQNVGRVYLDGINALSRLITLVGDSYQPTDTTLKTFDIRCDGAVVDGICLSNRFPMRESMASTNINFESVRIHSTTASCRLTISTKKASTLEELKLWLQDNPLEIIYALKTPIIHKVHIGNKNEVNTEVAKPNDVFTLPTLYTEQTHIDLTNNGIVPKVQSRDYIAYPVLPMIGRTYTLQHNLTGGVSNLTVDLLGRTQEITYQEPKSLIYSPESLVSNIKHKELRISGKGKISGVMYIDGGYMDRDIPYIEGMRNAVNPIVKNVGKNLFDGELEMGSIYLNNGVNYDSIYTIRTKNFIPIKSSTQYILKNDKNYDQNIIFYDEQQRAISYCSNTIVFITPINAKYLRFRCAEHLEQKDLNTKFQLEEGSVSTPYIEYKENICYVDCGEIRLTPDMFEQGSIYSVQAHVGLHYNDDKTNATTRLRTKNLIKVEPNETYVFMARNNDYVYSMHFYDKNGKKVGVASPYDLSWKGTTPFTIPSNCETGAIFIAKQQHTDITLDNIDAFDCGLIKVSEIKQLRSLPHGVQDEIDLETGKYIQRVGEITFNGIENWQPGYSSWDNKYTYWNHDFVDIKLMKGDNGSGQAYYDAVRCPQLHRSYMGRLASASIDGICSYYYSGYQRIFISKQDCATADELKLWLQENPITVQYELPEPIVKDIVIHNYPHSYEDGHVIIENGDPNTPIPAQLTYRAVTNRSGQIQQHTEQVEKQEREINELETLILANIHLSQTR